MKITVITTDSCGHCKKAIAQLRDSDIEYEVYDIRKARALIQRYGVNGLPFFILSDDKNNVITTWRGIEPLFYYLEGGFNMKKLKFLAKAKDKETGEIYEIGAVKNFPNVRADEILATGHAELVSDEVKTPVSKPKAKKPKAKDPEPVVEENDPDQETEESLNS